MTDTPTLFTAFGGWTTLTLLSMLLFASVVSWYCYRRIFHGVPESAHEGLQLVLVLFLIVTAIASWQGAMADTTPRTGTDQFVFVVGYLAGAPVVSTAFVLFLRATLLSADDLAQLQAYQAERRRHRRDRLQARLAGIGRTMTRRRMHAQTGKTRRLNEER